MNAVKISKNALNDLYEQHGVDLSEELNEELKKIPEEKKITKTQRIIDFLSPPIEPEILSDENPKKWIKMTNSGSIYYVPGW